jgi:hypothetical protein
MAHAAARTPASCDVGAAPPAWRAGPSGGHLLCGAEGLGLARAPPCVAAVADGPSFCPPGAARGARGAAPYGGRYRHRGPLGQGPQPSAGGPRGHAGPRSRQTCPSPGAFQEAATSFRLLDQGTAVGAGDLACLCSLGLPRPHPTSWRGGAGRTRPSPYARVRRGGRTLWRVQCPTGQEVGPVRPHCV